MAVTRKFPAQCRGNFVSLVGRPARFPLRGAAPGCLAIEPAGGHHARPVLVEGGEGELEVEEFPHNFGDSAPPRLDERVKERPRVVPGEGGVATDQQTDHQGQNYQLFVHPETKRYIFASL